MKFFTVCLISVFALLATSAAGQIDTLDTEEVAVVPVKKKGSIFKGRPGRAFLYSMIVPGAGQIYNKSYLRVPFVWGAVGGMGYLLHHNTREYNCRKAAYIALVDGNPVEPTQKHYCDPAIAGITDPGRMRILRDNANEARQTAIIGLSLVWLANGIDAFVNAHLKDFDVDDDLSIHFQTIMDQDPNSPVRYGLVIGF